MKKKIVKIVILMLVIATAVPAVTSLKNNKINTTAPTNCLENMAESWGQQQKLLPSDGAAGDNFGISVSIDGDTVLIGAYLDDDKGVDSGSAYVFTRTGTTWTQQAKLLASDGHPGDQFGYCVSLSGDTAFLGAPLDNCYGIYSGSAYVFTRTGTTWTQQAKLVPSDGAAYDIFGTPVSLSGDTVLIGANQDSDNGELSGSAYVFIRTGTTWTQQAKLVPSDGAANDQFGWSASLDGDTALIGSFWDSNNGVHSGSAYVFTRTGTTWIQRAKLLPSDGADERWFGWWVALDENTALIGASRDDTNGPNSGSAYVFTRTGTTWTQQAKLLASDGDSGDQFGYCVSLSGDTAFIGAHLNDDNGDDSGSEYVFIRTGTNWTQQAKLLPSDGAEGDWFGEWAASTDGRTALIGAPLDDDNGANSGSEYVFINNQPPGAPIIDGPTNGTAGTSYTYTFNSVDPDEDDVYYYIKWGDSAVETWDGPHASGTDFDIAHTYKKQGTYTIEAKAKDTMGAESGWSTLTVTMPKNKAINTPFLQFFHNFLQNHPNIFPILQKIILRF